MQVVCLEEKAFYALFDKVVAYLDEKQKEEPLQWIDGEQAMAILNITSKTTLQKLRDEGRIRFSQPQKRIILYDRFSLLDYLEQHAKEPF